MQKNQWIPLAVAVALVAVALPLSFAQPFDEDGAPKAANKTAASGESLQYLPSDFADDDQGVTVLSTYVKSSGPADLLLQVSLECALWTETAVTTIGDHESLSDTSEASADVEIWIEIDGERVPVSSDDTGEDAGKVTFCDRVQRQQIEDMDESTGNWTMRTYLETKTANSFNWVTLDVGSGTHLIEVKADIDAENTQGAFAQGAIGKRTLVVETVHFPPGATI